MTAKEYADTERDLLHLIAVNKGEKKQKFEEQLKALKKTKSR